MNKTLITFFTILFCLTSSVGYSQNIICEKTGYGCPDIDIKELVERNGVYYKKFTEIVFTGKTTGKEQGSLKNGKEDGSWIGYYDNGKLRYKGNYKNGKRHSSFVTYNEDGTVWEAWTGTFKNGVKITN